MFAVVVTFQIKSGGMEVFFPLMTENARASLREEPGCNVFDVCTDPARPDEVLLYELYSDRAAFDAHLASAHFKVFDKAVADLIATKTVHTYETVIR